MVFLLAWTLVGSAHAQSNAPLLKEVVVTATRTERALDDLVADVTVVDRDQIDRMGAVAVSEVLRQVPGIEITRNGGPATTTNVFIRGAESRFTAVFIDGVRVDSQFLSGGATWENLPLSQFDRIEVLRGPAGSVYGSDAMGGVVQLFTRRGEAGFFPYVSMGLATYSTSKLDAGLSGGQGDWDYAVSVGTEGSKGFNARASSSVSPDDDGYHNQTASARLGFKLNSAHRLSVNWLMNDITSQYDSTTTKLADHQSMRRLEASGLSWAADWTDHFHSRWSMSDSTDRYETAPSASLAYTRVRSYYLHNEWKQAEHLASVAMERREDSLNNATTTPLETARAQNGLALGYGWTNSRHAIQFNMRGDQDSEFGAKQTGAISYGFRITPEWRAMVAGGTSFKAPTLYQRFSTSGSPSLQPETGINREVGLQFARGSHHLGFTVYQNQVDNLIYFASNQGTCPQNLPTASGTKGCYFSTAKASYYGATLTAQTRLAETDLRASLDVQDPRDDVTGKMLQRRSPQHATLGVDRKWGEWALGASAILSGDRYDNNTNTTVLKGYTLLNLSAERAVGHDWKLQLRVDNATDAVYQLADTYNTPGRSLFVGLKWEP